MDYTGKANNVADCVAVTKPHFRNALSMGRSRRQSTVAVLLPDMSATVEDFTLKQKEGIAVAQR